MSIFPEIVVLKRQGRNLLIRIDDNPEPLVLDNYYTPLRWLRIKKHTLRLQHYLHISTDTLSATYHAPAILRKAKILKHGQEWYMW